MASNLNVIVTCYKEGNLIHRAIESLKAQTDKDFLIILVYDASKDPLTESICKHYEHTSDITLIWNERNLGLSGARNAGVEKMDGEIVVFLDADDTLPKNAIAIIKKEFVQHSDADFIYGNYFRYNIERHTKKKVDCSIITDENGLLSPSALAQTWVLMGQSPMRKPYFKKNQGYSTIFTNSCQDVDFWMRGLLIGAKGYYTNNYIYNWYQSEAGMNNSTANLQDLEKCKILNIDFFIQFHPNTHYVYQMLYQIKNINGIKKRARLDISKGYRNKRNTFYTIIPKFMLKILSKYVFT
jgi:glycosyltransferase involved in cell wall biosynthesis